MDMITYAHRHDQYDQPGHTRFLQYAKDPVPAWAVDIRPHVEVNSEMKIGIIKHFDKEDTEFYGDYYVTVEVLNVGGVTTPHDLLATYRGSNTDQAEAFACGYVQALQTVGHTEKHLEIFYLSKADAEEDVG